MPYTPVLVSAGLAAVAGKSAGSWAVGHAASAEQLARFTGACSAPCQALDRHGGPFLCGAVPSLVRCPCRCEIKGAAAAVAAGYPAP